MVDYNGQQININPGMGEQKCSKYKELPEAEKTKIKEVLYIMDRFCVGDVAYHLRSLKNPGRSSGCPDKFQRGY